MDENTVVKEQLTAEMIEAGAQLLQKLDELGMAFNIAMWFWIPEINEWRLMLDSPKIAEGGSLDLYKQIMEVRKTLGPMADSVPPSSIDLMNPVSELTKKMRAELHTGPGISRVRFRKNVVGGRYVDDALIYRSAA